jgi:hypothetical protein
VSVSETATVKETSFFEALENTNTTGLIYTSDQPVARAATHTTQNKTQETNIHNISGIRTYDFRNQVFATYAFDCMTTGNGWDIFI